MGVALYSFINLLGNGNFFLGSKEFMKDWLKYRILSKASFLSKDSVVAQDVAAFSLAVSPKFSRVAMVA